MFGNATLTIVESSVCISEAAITPITINAKRQPRSETSA